MSKVKLSELTKDHSCVNGDFNDLSVFDFYGVYILSMDEDIKYIGSAYAQKLKTRLNQYISETDTGGNSLRKKIDKKNPSNAIVEIKKFKITAIKNDDLEYDLISKANPIHNIKGIKKAGKTVEVLIKDEEQIPPLVE